LPPFAPLVFFLKSAFLFIYAAGWDKTYFPLLGYHVFPRGKRAGLSGARNPCGIDKHETGCDNNCV